MKPDEMIIVDEVIEVLKALSAAMPDASAHIEPAIAKLEELTIDPEQPQPA